MIYIAILFALLFVYVAMIFGMEKIGNVRVGNALFASIPVICYLILLIIVYFDVGFSDWNFQNALPTANVSPFMFSSLLIYFFLPKRAKKVWALLICLLSLGMLLSVVIACTSRAVIGYKFHFRFLLDYISHLFLSLFGIYLFKTGQVTVKKKDCLLSGGLIVGVALLMFLLNAIFGTAFFGLALDEHYGIYNLVLVSGWYFSALLYFAGLIGVLTFGYFYLKIFQKRTKDP